VSQTGAMAAERKESLSRVAVPRVSLSTATIVGIFAVIVLVGSLTTEGFATVENLKAILQSSAFVGIIAVGMTVIMLSGNVFSMSLGTTAAVTAITFLWALQYGTVAAILLTILLGLGICAVQGWIVGAIGANPIIITIAAGVIQAGATLKVSGGTTIYPPPDASYSWLADRAGGIPFPFIVFLLVTVVVDAVLRRTRFGRSIYAVGENKRAARAAAISIAAIAAGSFAVAGACTAIAGILIGATNGNASLFIESTYTFDAIAAVLVGGTAVTGGRGSAARTLFGAIVIATISSLLLLRGYSTGIQILVKGVIVLVVVILVQLGSRGRNQ
jgi:simple sugar transport system permease protein/ribose transport system permease protein